MRIKKQNLVWLLVLPLCSHAMIDKDDIESGIKGEQETSNVQSLSAVIMDSTKSKDVGKDKIINDLIKALKAKETAVEKTFTCCCANCSADCSSSSQNESGSCCSYTAENICGIPKKEDRACCCFVGLGFCYKLKINQDRLASGPCDECDGCWPWCEGRQH